MKNSTDNYSVYGFMTRELLLGGAELQVFAIIYSFQRATGGAFFGSRAYLASTAGISVRTVDRALKSLLSRGLIKATGEGYEPVLPRYIMEKG